MTGRRSVGIALVLAAVAVATVLPGLGGRRIDGTPIPAALAASPRIGECLLMPGQTGTGSGDASFGPCDGTTLGEVVAVHHRAIGSPAPPPEISCRASAVRYAGLLDLGTGYAPAGSPPTSAAGSPSAEPPAWTYPFRVDTRWIPQAPTLPATTSAWYACLASPPTTWQQGTLAGAFTGGRLPGAYGRCWVTTDPRPGNAMVACRWPHSAELIGIAAVDGDVAPAALQQSCRQLAAALLGRADPTVDGAVSAEVGPGDPIDPMASGAAFCYLRTADDRLIDGSLVGLKSASLSYQR